MHLSEILKPIVEVGILATAIYYVLKFIRGTRGAAVVTGFFTVVVVVAFLVAVFKLQVLSWIMNWFVSILALGILILFQPEIRRMLAELGTNRFTVSAHQQRENIEMIVQCAKNLSEEKMGGLIAIEQEAKVLETCSAPGILIDCVATPEMLQTIFFKDNALHDGGVIIKGDRILRASCVFPLSQRQDAVVIIVSEEKGFISYAYKGQLVTRVSEEVLRGFLTSIFVPQVLPSNGKFGFRSLFVKLGLIRNPAEEEMSRSSQKKKEKRS